MIEQLKMHVLNFLVSPMHGRTASLGLIWPRALGQSNCDTFTLCTQWRRQLDNWGGGANIHIFVFCIINFL
jgi:hypothetical protein